MTQKERQKWSVYLETMLQEPCVMVTQEKRHSCTEKMSEKQTEKYVQSTQRNYENGSIMAQKEVIKWSVL